jgi:hypothetical protein
MAIRGYLEGVSDTHSLGVGHLEALANLAKQFIIAARLARKPSKVPTKDEKNPQLLGTAHRDDLEDFTWKAVNETVAFSKTEKAAKDAEARLLALRVANGLMRTELMILKHQDDAYVDALLKELEVDPDGLAAKARKES